MNVYLDSLIVIYMVEQPPVFAAAVNRAIRQLKPSEYTCTELTRVETLIVPRRNGDQQLELDFEWFFGQSFVRFATMNRAVFDRAVVLRAKYRFLKTPDASHLASAIDSSCDAFLTNDVKLASVTEIAVHLI